MHSFAHQNCKVLSSLTAQFRGANPIGFKVVNCTDSGVETDQFHTPKLISFGGVH